MSTAPSSLSLNVIVNRLRGAGCVYAEDEARLLMSAAPTPDDLAAMVDRRVGGTPLEHVVGWSEFCGRRVFVEPGLFVPRRRTEFLVRQAVELARSPAPVIVELCCGTGAVGATLVASLDRARLYAVDVEPAAVRCAYRNISAAGGGEVLTGDLYQPLPAHLRGDVTMIVANPPYVPTEAIGLLPAEARLHEPHVSLDGGADGLDIARRIAAAAPLWLAPGGHLVVETGARQGARLAEIVARNGLASRVVSSAELNATVVIGTMPAPKATGAAQIPRARPESLALPAPAAPSAPAAPAPVPAAPAAPPATPPASVPSVPVPSASMPPAAPLPPVPAVPPPVPPGQAAPVPPAEPTAPDPRDSPPPAVIPPPVPEPPPPSGTRPPYAD
jgi:release factor glutamine methyltransferase